MDSGHFGELVGRNDFAFVAAEVSEQAIACASFQSWSGAMEVVAGVLGKGDGGGDRLGRGYGATPSVHSELLQKCSRPLQLLASSVQDLAVWLVPADLL